MLKPIPDDFWPWLRGEESESDEHEQAMLQAFENFKYNILTSTYILRWRLEAEGAYFLDFD